MKSAPVLAALTGGMASGKSEVARLFASLGAAVLDCDSIARGLLAPGGKGLEAVVGEFGDRFLAPDGVLDRGMLRRALFADPELRARLDAVIHPLVRDELKARITAMAEDPRPPDVIVVEVPLLFEAGWEDDFDVVIAVRAEREIMIERIRRRDGTDRRGAAVCLAAQMDPEEKAARADHVVDNGGSLADTAVQVERIWNRIKNLTSRRW